MTNEEFAEQLANTLIVKEDTYITEIAEQINDFLQENNLLVINTKDQLLGYCSDSVAGWYESNVENYQKKYPIAPDELTIEQSQYLLNLADTLNSNHELGFCWDDIDEAIEQWLDENYATKLD